MSTRIRPLVADDAAAYHALRLEGLRWYPEAFRSAYEDEAGKPVEWARRRIVAAAENPQGFALGAFQTQAPQPQPGSAASEGRLIGAVVLETHSAAKRRHCAQVLGMLVAPEFLGQGIGSALLRELMLKAGQLDAIEQLHLTVTATNEPAIRLYARYGFVAGGVERRALKIGAQYFDKLHMTAVLDELPAHAEFALQMTTARQAMRERRDALAALAKASGA